MKNYYLKTLLVLFSIMLFTSCENDSADGDYIPRGDYDRGFIVSNEGNFGSPNASVGFISEDLQTSIDGIFGIQNNDDALGDVLQSITFDDKYAYLIVNNSNKVVVVDRYTFKHVATLTDNIATPRYAEVENGKLYITNSGSRGIAVYNIADFTFNTSIDIGRTVEQITIEGNFIYVQNAAFGFGKNITVVDINTNTVVKTLETGDGLNSMEEEGGILYAMHKTGITKINTITNEVIGEITLAGSLTNPTKMDIEDNIIYFISGAKIYSSPLNGTELSETALIDTQVNGASWSLGYGFAVESDKIFYSDVKGFTENSAVLVYDLQGQLLESISTGMGTNNVYFND